MSSVSIQNVAMDTYQKNLEFFQKSFPEVYEKVSLLDMAIAQGLYQEKFSLEYKDTYFDVRELSSGAYLYAENSIEYSKNLASFIDKSKDKRVIEAFYRDYFTAKELELALKVKPQENPRACLLPIIDFVYTHGGEKRYLKQIKKCIFLGVGLGMHIEPSEKS